MYVNQSEISALAPTPWSPPAPEPGAWLSAGPPQAVRSRSLRTGATPILEPDPSQLEGAVATAGGNHAPWEGFGMDDLAGATQVAGGMAVMTPE